MTTENVAVLFTDMVGSTALATSLAPDAADELRLGVGFAFECNCHDVVR